MVMKSRAYVGSKNVAGPLAVLTNVAPLAGAAAPFAVAGG